MAYKLYCFGESGNSYKAALMLSLCAAKWEPIFVDYFNGETKTNEYRSNINEMGEAPVLDIGDRKLSQSGVILDYLSRQFGKFGANSEEEWNEILGWLLFDNHKFTSYIATWRFMVRFMNAGESETCKAFATRAQGALNIVENHLAKREFIALDMPTIADISMCAYLMYGDELPFKLSDYPNISNWLERISSLEGFKPPYEIMPCKK